MKKELLLQVGFGRTDITPELGVRLGGYGVKERPAEQILDRLHATAMVVREPQVGAPVLFLNGAIGDVGPRTNVIRKGTRLSAGGGDGIESVREVGYRAATDAIRALVSIREFRSDLALAVLSEEIFLPYAPLTPLDDARQAVEKWESRKDEWGHPMAEYRHNQSVVEAHSRPLLEGRKFMQTIIRIGPLAVIPMPGEMFAAISLRIRENSPFPYPLCCSVSNGSLSYLPTREARHRGGYETWVGRAAGPYLLADDIDDALVAENLRLLNRMAGNP